MGLKRTALYEAHRALGARLVEFAGWEMPVQYSGIIEEHLMVRSSCGLFDVSHMGEIEITGPGAHDCVQHLITNDIDRIRDGQCLYTLVCYPDGGIVDDCIVYRFGDERYIICTNASNTEKAYEWMKEKSADAHWGEVQVRDVSSSYAQLALQGPAAEDFLQPLVNIDLAELKSFHFAVTGVFGFRSIVSRTGYTGEDGFEIYLDPENATQLWKALLAHDGILPCGLGARDTLRLEMGYPLYGHELSEKITPVEAGLHKRFVSFDKRDFIGKDILKNQAEEGVEKKLVGVVLTGTGVARAGYEITHEGRTIGKITSGTLSPSLKMAVAMAYVEPEFAKKDTEIEVVIRKKPVKARVMRPPFYKKKSSEDAARLEEGKLYRTGLSSHRPG